MVALNGNGHAAESPSPNGSASQPLSYMAALGARLIDNGWPILPIWPGTKAPGSFSRGQWSGYNGWSKHCSRPTTLIEASVWSRWPDCGVGLPGGEVCGVDIDIVEDKAVADAVERLARQMLGDGCLLRVGLWPKRLLVYRTKEPFAGIKEFYPIEIMARGQQMVAYARHPETGLPYQWIGDTPAETHLTGLQAVSEAQVRRFLAEAYKLIPERLRVKRLSDAGNGERHIASGRIRGTVPAIASALEFLPNPDLPYDEWINVGLATCAAIGDEGEQLWAAWSAKAGKNDPAKTAKTWRGFRQDKIHSLTAGTIYYLAEQAGWRPSSDLILDGDAPAWEPGEHPAQALITLPDDYLTNRGYATSQV